MSNYAGKELIEKQLDLLVEMSEFCKNKPNFGYGKCLDCALNSSINCFLVDLVNFNDAFIETLLDRCIDNDIEYTEKLNKIAEGFVTNY